MSMFGTDGTLAPCAVCGAMVRVTDGDALERHAAWHVRHGDIKKVWDPRRNEWVDAAEVTT